MSFFSFWMKNSPAPACPWSEGKLNNNSIHLVGKHIGSDNMGLYLRGWGAPSVGGYFHTWFVWFVGFVGLVSFVWFVLICMMFTTCMICMMCRIICMIYIIWIICMMCMTCTIYSSCCRLEAVRLVWSSNAVPWLQPYWHRSCTTISHNGRRNTRRSRSSSIRGLNGSAPKVWPLQ